MPRCKRLLIAVTFGVTFGVVTSVSAQTAPFPAFGSAVWGGVPGDNKTPYGDFTSGNDGFYSLTQSSANGSMSNVGTGSYASAEAQLAQGSVSAAVYGMTYGDIVPCAAFPGCLGYVPGGANAHALIWDTLTFSGAAPGATVTLTMSGTAYLQDDARLSVNADLLPVASEGQIGTPYSLLEGNLSQPISIAVDGSYSVQNSFAISNDVPFLFAIGVHAQAGGGGSGYPLGYGFPPPGNAWITDPFSLDLPTGVTFTSASGQLVAAVPEPETYPMMLAGLGLMGFMARRRKQ